MKSTDSDYRKGYTRGLRAARRILTEAMEGGKGKHKDYVGVFDEILTETETVNGTVKEEWNLFQPFEKVYFNDAEEMEAELIKACGGHPSNDRTESLSEGEWRFEYSTKRRNGTGTITDKDWDEW